MGAQYADIRPPEVSVSQIFLTLEHVLIKCIVRTTACFCLQIGAQHTLILDGA